MIRLRVSTLEEYRRLVMTDFGSESELVDRLKRGQWVDGPSNWQMDAGTAWHAVLADPIRHKSIAFDKDGKPRSVYVGGSPEKDTEYEFDGEAVHAALRHQVPGLREVTGRKVFTVGGTPVQVQGTCDHIRGLFIRDSKAKFSTPEARAYQPSLQWRFYLSIFDAASFTYDLFDFADPKERYCRLKDIVSFRLWAYPDLDLECRDWIGRFLSWADGRKLLPLLEPQQRAA